MKITIKSVYGVEKTISLIVDINITLYDLLKKIDPIPYEWTPNRWIPDYGFRFFHRAAPLKIENLGTGLYDLFGHGENDKTLTFSPAFPNQFDPEVIFSPTLFGRVSDYFYPAKPWNKTHTLNQIIAGAMNSANKYDCEAKKTFLFLLDMTESDFNKETFDSLKTKFLTHVRYQRAVLVSGLNR